MIVQIKGTLEEINGSKISIETNNITYEIEATSSLIDSSSLSQPITAIIRHIQKEDGSTLYGFKSKPERFVFDEVIKVSGIGGKIAIAMLNQIGLNNILSSLQNKDEKTIQTVSGVGKKTANRLILELQGIPKKVNELFPQLNVQDTEGHQWHLKQDAIDAISAIGIQDTKRAIQIIDDTIQSNKDISLEKLIQIVLQHSDQSS